MRATGPHGDVALKTTCLDARPDTLARAHNEVRGLQQAAAHPRTADLAAHGVHQHLHYLAITWQRGLSLHQLLGHLDHSMAAPSLGATEFFARFALALCHAVEGLHHHGIVHADLSPRNIILGHDHTLTLIDLDSCLSPGDPAPGTLHR
ncbi:hypothetical protein ADK60_20685, partial [Streptomyces sp. XY431]|uniref:protein kinase domain-containing protein n=1 Tax=Streptomyces sp. XY431 TaxID=1415562 RepID=UPI0006C15572